MSDIDKLMEFIRFTDEFRRIERTVFSRDHGRQESDAEHSFQLALAAWFIVDSKRLDLDLGRVIRYSLAHDLVEVYAGDTYFYTKSQKERDSKKRREEEAALKIRERFPEFPQLHEAIDAYERKDDAESRFVYALDKVLAPMNIYLDGGRAWKEMGITLDMLLTNKAPKVAADPDVARYFAELAEMLKRDEARLFPAG